jgi:3-hydroxybutyryl-CoA dehydratase
MSSQSSGSPATAMREFTGAWADASGHLLSGIVEANRAGMAAMGVSTESDEELEGTEVLDFREADWSCERSVEDPEQIGVGDAVRFSKPVDDEDILDFARASGDTNRLHLDDEFAKNSRFGRRIAHGTLASGLISAALARLPGLTIYLSQDLRFEGPADIGERLTAHVEVDEVLGDGRYHLVTIVEDEEGETLVDGEAVVLIDPLPGEETAAVGPTNDD